MSYTEVREFESGLEGRRVRVGVNLGGYSDPMHGEFGTIAGARKAIAWGECELLIRFDRPVRLDRWTLVEVEEAWLTYSRIDWGFEVWPQPGARKAPP